LIEWVQPTLGRSPVVGFPEYRFLCS